jgi:hypothetical protein
MPSPYISKSDFKACYDCRTKLYYRKNQYPTSLDENEYMQFLAEGGFMVETVAKAQYPQGHDLVNERDPQRAFAQTQELIGAPANAVIFEAAVLWGKFYARTDMLRREGKVLHLIEIKSSSILIDPEEDDGVSPFVSNGEVRSAWKEYLLDVAFQTRLLRNAFPKFEVKPWLCLVNKAHAVTANETMANFRVVRDARNPNARPEVVYSGDRGQLKDSPLLITLPVSAEVDSLMPEVEAMANTLAALLRANGTMTRVQEPVAGFYKTCRGCEYRFRDGRPIKGHGFAECWGKMAKANPHILELHRVGQIGTSKVPDPVPALLATGRASLLDLREDQLGKPGTWQERRQLQWSHSGPGAKEYLPKILQKELHGHQTDPGWPLHFLDFEACDIALPHHAGLRSYERVAFQFSVHQIDRKGNLTHQEWLNTGRDFPNFAFAQALRVSIGDEGTVYVWSPYEQATLNRVLVQIEEWLERDAKEAVRVAGLRSAAELRKLADWLDRLLGSEDEKGKRHDSPRIRDLHKLALEHYFHPDMGGRTSIKVVLPAIWSHSQALRNHPWFAQYLKLGANGQPIDPYKTLPALPLGDAGDDEESITDGTGAIRVYQDLIFRQEADPKIRANREQLLKQYCELDTAAMVMIWQHWIDTPASRNLI